MVYEKRITSPLFLNSLQCCLEIGHLLGFVDNWIFISYMKIQASSISQVLHLCLFSELLSLSIFLNLWTKVMFRTWIKNLILSDLTPQAKKISYFTQNVLTRLHRNSNLENS